MLLHVSSLLLFSSYQKSLFFLSCQRFVSVLSLVEIKCSKYFFGLICHYYRVCYFYVGECLIDPVRLKFVLKLKEALFSYFFNCDSLFLVHALTLLGCSNILNLVQNRASTELVAWLLLVCGYVLVKIQYLHLNFNILSMKMITSFCYVGLFL